MAIARPVSSPTGARGLLAPAAVAVGALAGCVTLALVDPERPGSYPVCPFLALTGRWCPGCGSLRATSRLIRGDLVGAIGFNVLLVVLLPYVLYRYVVWTADRVGGPRLPRANLPASAIWALLGVVLAFWLLRNLAAFAWLAPAG